MSKLEFLSHQGRVLASVVCLGFGVVSPAWAQDGDPGDVAELEAFAAAMAEGEPAFDLETATAWMAEVAPLVEEVAGREFDAPPVLACVTRSELAEVLEAELLVQLDALKPDGAGGPNRVDAVLQAAGQSARLLGKYGYADGDRGGTVYLVPGNVASVLDLGGFDQALVPAVVKVMLAHELVHLLQDQQSGLGGRIAELKTQDAVVSFNAVTEGMAVITQEEVACRLGLEEAAAALRQLMPGGGLLEKKFPAVAARLHPDGIYPKIIYDYGRAYMRNHWDEGGAARMWEVFDRAPVPLNDITNTREGEVGGRKFSDALAGKELLFGGEGPWKVQLMSIDQSSMERQFAALEPELRDLMLEQIESVTAYIATRRGDGGPQMIAFNVARIKDPEFAATYISVNDKNLADRLGPAKAAGMDVTTSERDLDLGGGISGKERVFAIVSPDESQRAEQFATDLAKGKTFFQIVTMNVPVPDGFDYGELVEGVLTGGE